jgi:hypothetical protein
MPRLTELQVCDRWNNSSYPESLHEPGQDNDFKDLACELFSEDEVAEVIAGRNTTDLSQRVCDDMAAWIRFRKWLREVNKYPLEKHSTLGLGFFEELFHRASRLIKVGKLTSERVVEMWNCYGLPDIPDEKRSWIECTNEVLPSAIFEDKAAEVYSAEEVQLVVNNFRLPGRVTEISKELIALTLFESWLEEHFEYDLSQHETLGLKHFDALFKEALDLLQKKPKLSDKEIMVMWNLHQPTLSADPSTWREREIFKDGFSLQRLLFIEFGSKKYQLFFTKPPATLELQSLYGEVRTWIDFRQHLLDAHGTDLTEHPEIGLKRVSEWIHRIMKIQMAKPCHCRDRSPTRRTKQ